MRRAELARRLEEEAALELPLLRIVYHGPPAVKKNRHQVIPAGPGGRPLLVPNQAYRKAERRALREIREAGPYPAAPFGGAKQLLHACAHFYIGERQRPDLDGLISGCADILEGADLVANDYWIRSWDGSRVFRDVADPRTEVTLFSTSFQDLQQGLLALDASAYQNDQGESGVSSIRHSEFNRRCQ